MDKRAEKADPAEQPPVSLRGPEASEILEAFLGFDVRLWHTVRDLIIHPVRIARDALDGKTGVYLGQVRLFIFLLGIQTILFTLMKTYDFVSVNVILQKDEMLQRYAQLLQTHGSTLQQVNDALVGWFNMLITPLNALSIIFYALFFKLLQKRITILGHALLFMTASNAATLVITPLVTLASHVFRDSIITNMLAIPIQFFYLGLFVWTFMHKSTLGGLLRLIFLLFIFLLFIVVSNILVWSIMDVLIEHRFGIGPWHFLFQQALEPAQAARAAVP